MTRSNEQQDRLAAALRMTASMALEEDLVALLRRGLSLCLRVFDCERALVISRTADGVESIVGSAGEGERDGPHSTTAIRLAEEKGKPLLISDTIGQADLEHQESISMQNIRSVLCARLDYVDTAFSNNRVYLYLDSHTDRHPFEECDLERFRILTTLMTSLVDRSQVLAQREAEIEELRGQVGEKRFEDLVFSSESFGTCLETIKQGAEAGVPVLIQGETGTGKEMLARLVHKLSPRKENTFLAVNCASIPPNLIESHLFGHIKGSFTGAVADRKGFFEQASGGTLFLDEIGDMPIEAQSHLLRTLQEGEVVPVGATKPIQVDVRVVAATNVDLEKAVGEGLFRQDLYYRLSVLPVHVPPVRERGQDALVLARYFLAEYCENYGGKKLEFTRDAEKAILFYPWPGNVREIQNKVQRAVITAQAPRIDTSALGIEPDTQSQPTSLREAREALDREMISQALKRSPGNLTNAARILDIDRKSLRLLIEKYGI